MKKILAIMLTLILSCGMFFSTAITASAATYKITGFTDDGLINLTRVGTPTVALPTDGFDKLRKSGDNKADETFRLQLRVEDFTWEKDIVPNQLTSAMLDDVRITLNDKKNMSAVRGVDFNLDKGAYHLRLRTVEFYTKTSETEWSTTIKLEVKRGTAKNTVAEIQASGVLKNAEILCYQEDNGMELDKDEYIKADETLRNFEFELEENIFITKNISNGTKVYAAVTLDLSTADEEVFAKYGTIDSIYTLHTTNVAGAGTTVRFDLASTYFVYNQDKEFIGTTADKKLPFSNKYYLTTAKVADWETVAEEDGDGDGEPTEPVDPQNPASGGGDTVANANYNPNTGL